MITREGLINFIHRNPPPEDESSEDMLIASAWLQSRLSMISGEIKYPVYWLQRVDGDWHYFKKESKDAEIQEIPWIEDPEPCTMEDLYNEEEQALQANGPIRETPGSGDEAL